jgi:hypothetical protein
MIKVKLLWYKGMDTLFLPVATTSYPFLRKNLANPSPRPEVPPVISIFPFKEGDFSISAGNILSGYQT